VEKKAHICTRTPEVAGQAEPDSPNVVGRDEKPDIAGIGFPEQGAHPVGPEPRAKGRPSARANRHRGISPPQKDGLVFRRKATATWAEAAGRTAAIAPVQYTQGLPGVRTGVRRSGTTSLHPVLDRNPGHAPQTQRCCSRRVHIDVLQCDVQGWILTRADVRAIEDEDLISVRRN